MRNKELVEAVAIAREFPSWVNKLRAESITEEDVRRIVREELAAAAMSEKYLIEVVDEGLAKLGRQSSRAS